MTRAQRLLELIQILRAHRYPVTAAELAEILEISTRSVYRDIISLKQQGVNIEGGTGVGYILQSDYQLPPLMFSQHEIDALILGLNWVAQHTDSALKQAASHSLAKIHAVIPEHLKQYIEYPSLIIGPADNSPIEIFIAHLRSAIYSRNKIELVYEDLNQNISTQIIWPIALAYMESSLLLAGWCELKDDFRHFRTDRIKQVTQLSETYPISRNRLLKQWMSHEKMQLSRQY